jgi:hypothetical protein
MEILEAVVEQEEPVALLPRLVVVALESRLRLPELL